jgi:hypothetical protein
MDGKWVTDSSLLLGFHRGEDRLKNVTEQLVRIEQIASALDAVELDPATDELAPVWRP